MRVRWGGKSPPPFPSQPHHQKAPGRPESQTEGRYVIRMLSFSALHPQFNPLYLAMNLGCELPCVLSALGTEWWGREESNLSPILRPDSCLLQSACLPAGLAAGSQGLHTGVILPTLNPIQVSVHFFLLSGVLGSEDPLVMKSSLFLLSIVKLRPREGKKSPSSHRY